MSLTTPSQQLNCLQVPIRMTIGLLQQKYLGQFHISLCDWQKSAGGFRARHCPPNALVHFQFLFAHSHLALLLYACASVMHLSASSHYEGPGVISERRHSDPAMGRADMQGTLWQARYTPPPLQNVNYLIRFAETASGRRKRVRGPACGTRTSVGGSRRGCFRSVAPYRAVWSLIPAADFALGRNSLWRGWEQDWTVLLSRPLSFSSALFYLSLSHTHFLHSIICKFCGCIVEGKTWAVFWEDDSVGRKFF